MGIRRASIPLVLAIVMAACGGGSDSSADDSGIGASALGLRFGTLTERTLDRNGDGSTTTAAVESLNAFAVDLYRAVSPEPIDNVIISPYSVAFALGMIYAGAAGTTAAEMEDVLHHEGLAADWHAGINLYDLSLDARTADSPTDWASANKVWVTPGLPLVDDFLDVLTGDYGSPIAEADFASDPEGERQVINGWIEQQTNELIPELFPEGEFGGDTAMVLVNAIALDAPWEFPFDPKSTRDGEFTLLDGTTVLTPLMHYDEYLPTGFGDGYQAVELPYGDGALSMVIIVPDDLPLFESMLTPQSLDAVFGSISDGGIHLTMPKWSARTHANLNQVLIDLGMPSAFNNADFSGMTEGGGLFLDTVEHEAVVEVDEQGTRAAAATGGEMALSHGPTVDVNRPFLYVIRDRGAGTILFIGRLTDPTAT